MLRKFVSNLGLLLVLNLLIKPIWIFAIDRNVQNAVGSEEYGLYFVLFDLSYVFSIFLDLGITNYNNRNIAQHRQTLGKYFAALFQMKAGLGVLYLILTSGFALFIGYRTQDLELLGILLFNQFLASLLLFMRSNISGILEFKKDSILSILDKSLMILFCSILLWGLDLQAEFNIMWFAYAQGISYLIAVFVAWLLLRPYLSKIEFGISKAFILSIIKQSLPYAILILFMSIYYKSGTVILDYLSPGSSAVGEYAKSYRILDSVIMLGNMFVALLFPIFSNMTRRGGDLNEIVQISSRLLLIPAIVVSTLCFLFGSEVLHLLYPEASERTILAFRVLMISFIPISFVNIYGTLLTASGKLKYMIGVSAAAILLGFSLNILLVPENAELGTAIATLSSHSLAAVFFYGIARSRHQVGLGSKDVVLLVCLMPLAYGIHISMAAMELNWILEVLGIGLVSFAFVWLSGLLKFRELTLVLLRRDSSLEAHIEEEEEERGNRTENSSPH